MGIYISGGSGWVGKVLNNTESLAKNNFLFNALFSLSVNIQEKFSKWHLSSFHTSSTQQIFSKQREQALSSEPSGGSVKLEFKYCYHVYFIWLYINSIQYWIIFIQHLGMGPAMWCHPRIPDVGQVPRVLLQPQGKSQGLWSVRTVPPWLLKSVLAFQMFFLLFVWLFVFVIFVNIFL